MAKKRGRKKQETEVQAPKQPQTTNVGIGIDEGLLKQAERELKNSKYITPFRLSQKLGVNVSIAKKVLKELEKRGTAKLYSPGKRDPIYIPM